MPRHVYAADAIITPESATLFSRAPLFDAYAAATLTTRLLLVAIFCWRITLMPATYCALRCRYAEPLMPAAARYFTPDILPPLL